MRLELLFMKEAHLLIARLWEKNGRGLVELMDVYDLIFCALKFSSELVYVLTRTTLIINHHKSMMLV